MKSKLCRTISALSLVAVTLLSLTNCNSNKKSGPSTGYPVFEDGMTWFFEDGSAKVKTFDGVEASMKATEVVNYLKKYKAFKTTRMSVRFMYPINGLDEVLPLAEQFNNAGIRMAIAINDEMLKTMTMPEYRRAHIYDLDDGRYEFELNCIPQGGMGIHIMGIHGYEPPQPQKLTTIGDLELMKKWVSLFDGHGIAIQISLE